MTRLIVPFLLVALAACAAKPSQEESTRTPSAVPQSTKAAATKKTETKQTNCQDGLVQLGSR